MPESLQSYAQLRRLLVARDGYVIRAYLLQPLGYRHCAVAVGVRLAQSRKAAALRQHAAQLSVIVVEAVEIYLGPGPLFCVYHGLAFHSVEGKLAYPQSDQAAAVLAAGEFRGAGPSGLVQSQCYRRFVLGHEAHDRLTALGPGQLNVGCSYRLAKLRQRRHR